MQHRTILSLLFLAVILIHSMTFSQEMPTVKKQVNPWYPAVLKLAGVEGDVSIRVVVNEKGDVDKATVENSTNHDFDDAALQAVKQWQFTPALKDGKPIRAEITIPFKFKLHGDLISQYEDEIRIRKESEQLLSTGEKDDLLSFVDTGTLVIIGNRLEKLHDLLLNDKKRSMLVEGSTTMLLSSLEKIEQSGTSGFMVLHTKPSDKMEDRYHTIVFGRNEDGSWKIRCWQTSVKK